MAETLFQLYPFRPGEQPLRGTYLAHRLHEIGSRMQPFVYADFVASLDGRIALRDPGSSQSQLPQALTSSNGLRLLLELHAQADCLITHGGYMRAIAEARLDDILQVGTVAGHEDLGRWRTASGLVTQPAVCVASASLDFPLPESLARNGQRVFLATGAAAQTERVLAFERRGYEVIIAGAGKHAEGAPLVRALAQRGYRSAFLLAGPRMLETMLRDGVLSRLYLTITHQLLGGEHFHSLVEGPELHGAGRLRLNTLYLDPLSPQGIGQLFGQFEPVR